MKKDPTRQIFNLVPASLKRFKKLLICPDIPTYDIEKTDLYFVYHDFIFALSLISIIIKGIKGLLPNYFIVNPASLINYPVFILLLSLNALIPSILIFSLLLIPLYYKTKRVHVCIFYHSLRAYSLEIILVSILFVIAINRIFINNTPFKAINNIELIFSVIISAFTLFFLYWLIGYPVSKYLTNFFSKKIAYSLGIGSILFCLYINPTLSFKYFNNIIDYKEFCIQYVDYKFQKEVTGNIYNKDCLIGKCFELKEKFLP
ncbi:hypothetical protein SAMN04488516_10210 [Desulfonauticus submarinus]|uniref:Yip1 domain-containing protein n=1 Tax=Desulfonauticus submarinus TaxID=206665 RepID=A0A1H0B2J1_9BACT|nr:hypothetical protein [Desulfonauticus submarinus]SDN39869.1 hypothetical protein SAMN04488516_10210 [Desulfonauticus submarinus]